jgi:hypothetical protein
MRGKSFLDILSIIRSVGTGDYGPCEYSRARFWPSHICNADEFLSFRFGVEALGDGHLRLARRAVRSAWMGWLVDVGLAEDIFATLRAAIRRVEQERI